MSQSVQELIGKIRREGLEASQQQAREIEAQARAQAAALLQEAKAQAAKIVADAHAERERIEQATRASLQQAARNTLISLKQELGAQLQRILRRELRAALAPERLAELITAVATAYMAAGGEARGIEIALDAKNRAVLQESLLAKLQESLKQGVTLRTADDVGGGFTISFDAGRSCFDFSEESLARYLGAYSNEYLEELLRQS